MRAPANLLLDRKKQTSKLLIAGLIGYGTSLLARVGFQTAISPTKRSKALPSVSYKLQRPRKTTKQTLHVCTKTLIESDLMTISDLSRRYANGEPISITRSRYFSETRRKIRRKRAKIARRTRKGDNNRGINEPTRIEWRRKNRQRRRR